jgi:antitoxin ParD1/3/4
MNVSLTPELERLVAEKVQNGMYRSASEVVRAALRLLVEQDQIRQLRKEQLRIQIERGVADLDAGSAGVFDDAVVAENKRTGRSTRGGRR